MAEPLPLGTIEGHLCGHLAASLCRFFAGHSGNQKGRSIMQSCSGDWIVAEEALLAIGVMHVPPIDNDGKKELPVFSMNAEEMPSFVTTFIFEGDPRIPQMIQAFVAIACGGYEKHPLSDRREWFDAPPHYLIAMKWLTRLGYAERNRGTFRWTEKIAPAMRAGYLWNEEGFPFWEAEEAEQQAECELIWATMPDTLKHSLKTGAVGLWDLVKILALGWRDGQWHTYEPDQRIELAGQVTLAQRLLELAEHAG